MAIHHAKSGEIVDLHELGIGLRRAQTTAIVKSPTFEVVRLVVHAGTDIPSHQVSGAIMLHCLEGRVVLTVAESTVEFAAGQWVYLDGAVRHALKGIEESSLLLTILFDREDGKSAGRK